MRLLYVRHWVQDPSLKTNTHTHTHIHGYTYLYTCLCIYNVYQQKSIYLHKYVYTHSTLFPLIEPLWKLSCRQPWHFPPKYFSIHLWRIKIFSCIINHTIIILGKINSIKSSDILCVQIYTIVPKQFLPLPNPINNHPLHITLFLFGLFWSRTALSYPITFVHFSWHFL